MPLLIKGVGTIFIGSFFVRPCSRNVAPKLYGATPSSPPSFKQWFQTDRFLFPLQARQSLSDSCTCIRERTTQDAQKGCPARPQQVSTGDLSELARVRFPGMARMSSPLRASNEGLLRPRVARAQGDSPGHPSPAGRLFQHPASVFLAEPRA